MQHFKALLFLSFQLSCKVHPSKQTIHQPVASEDINTLHLRADETPAGEETGAHGGRLLLNEDEAGRLAKDYLLHLTKNDRLPDSISEGVSCSSRCIVPRTNLFADTCSLWFCELRFGDHNHPIVSYPIELTVDGDDVHVGISGIPATEIDIQACFNAVHECRIAVPSTIAQAKLGLMKTPQSLGIAWDPDRGEFFWVSRESEERINCHYKSAL